ncbi:B12-binding domain-containing radical SAM protein [Candidatus Woesearchaeota archaeon CG10_big_fil_rev_8_21_14_0_10_44_13]|nr:MAG: B12-binding domain-containing radical SAM protein [Candidatus Woesearchaeota archaeon CG10_big_fil_rev_8_21_14_0_10_44_13]
MSLDPSKSPDKKIDRIMLIQPPYTILKDMPKGCQPPLGLAYIAAVLENEAYGVKILDAVAEGFNDEVKLNGGFIKYGLSWDEIKERISDFKPDMVGVSCLFSMQSQNAHKVCEIAKKVDSRVYTVLGGAHPTSCPKEVMEDKNVDFIVLGEGERSFLELIKKLEKGHKNSLSDIDGIVFRKNNKTIINPKTRFIEDLDGLPFPARHLLPMDKYFRINKPHGSMAKKSPNTPLITSRGCPANCIFCSIKGVWGKKFRSRSPENVLLELEHLKKQYGIKEIQFEDDNLTFNKERAERIFDMMVENNLDMSWTTPNGVALWALNESLIKKMKNSGCYRLCFAIESGDPYVLNKIIKKPLDLNHAKRIIKYAKKEGIESDAFFVVGFPEETKEQIKRTFRFARDLDVDNVNFFIATPYPGTELYDQCRKKGILGDFSDYSCLNVKKASIETDNFSRKYLEREVAVQGMLFRLNLLIRHPMVFFNRVVVRFFRQPGFFVSYALRILKNMLS